MSWGDLWWGLLALAGLAGVWLCAGMETGIYTLDRVRLRVRAGRGDPAARVLMREVHRSEEVLATLLIANAVFGYLGAMGIGELLHRRGYSDGAVVALDALILTPLLLVACEAFPKELFRVEADRLTYRLAWVLRGMRLAMTVVPAVPLVRDFARWVARLIGAEGEEGLVLTGGQRVGALLRESAEAGALSREQARLVDRALRFHRARVGELMVPWGRVRAMGVEWDRGRVLRLVAAHPHAWYPAVDRQGRVLGVVAAEDVLLKGVGPLERLVRPAARVHPAMPAREALVLVRRAEGRVALVERDGRPVGLAVERDLIEPLTGELG